MKKAFGFYAIIWALLLGVFNLIAFIIPDGIAGASKLTGTFWIGYIFITIAFVGQLACAYVAFKAENLQKMFYNIPIINVSYIGLVVMLIVGALTMAIPVVPNWIGIIVCMLVLAATAIAVLSAAFASDVVSDIDNRVKAKTEFIKMLTVEAEHLVATSKTDALKAEAKKIYEAVRYSDPMSHVALVETEEKIRGAFSAFESAVDSEDEELAASCAAELLANIDIRNKKCRLLK